jgi:hypothetical protein
MSETEGRTANRTRSFLRGEIVHSNGNSRTECTVRDLSDTGARIEAPPSVTVPEYFDLVIPQRNIRHRARIVWRHQAELGLTFEDILQQPAPVAEQSSPEIRIRMMELELETAKLRAQLAEMRSIVEVFVRDKKSA